MENCVKCGKELQENNEICPYCGFKNLSLNSMSVENENSLIFIEGGTFTMGSDAGLDTEKPAHKVTVSSYHISKYQITQKDWSAIMGSNPSEMDGDYFPVENVNWYDAVQYCNKRSLKENLTPCYTINGEIVTCNFDANGYRLPTEAEWEYAMRGGKKTKGAIYSGSNDINEVAWFIENSEFASHPVGIKMPNELGIYDMSGNVYEWCWDIYDIYSPDTQVNPKGPDKGTNRVFRGGSWSSKKEYCTVANRYYNNAEKSIFNIGLRLVRTSI